MTDEQREWHRPQDELPPDGEVVNTLNSHGQVTQLRRQGNLWFFADGSMYVYYVPTFWQRIAALEQAAVGGERP